MSQTVDNAAPPTTSEQPDRPRTAAAAEPFAWRPVSVVAGVLALALLLASGRYAYFGDELYFLSTGKHPDWGYLDQPPLLPLPAHALDVLAPATWWCCGFPPPC
ncbi:hypothetical protein [Saccharothrix sp. ST-888]|uniref:hypothetical protein n=1 Tax=Saccharothrix sp. ST-888 TaxID=1427391 RepID=UPI00268EE14E